MTIGIDIRVLTRGARTGVEEYTINLLNFLLPLDKKIKYKLFYNAYRKAELNYSWAKLGNVEIKKFGFPNRALFFANRLTNQPKIDRLLKGVDVFFNPHFFVAPVSNNCKKAVTFHDLSFKLYPEFFSRSKRIWQKILMNAKKEAQKAGKIIAVSNSTKQDLIDFYKIPEEKIKVIYSGIEQDFKKGISDEKILKVKKKYRLPDKFILYFGTIEPRKNLIGLIKAFEIFKKNFILKQTQSNIKKKQFSNIQLVIAGEKGWLYKNVFKMARQSSFSSEIIFTGFVNNSDKPYLYKLASLFVYPSFYEGFGFPPLEAMSCGIPTITSKFSSLPETVGKAAIMIDPYDIDEFACAMNLALNDENLREKLKKQGFEQVKKFSWQKCAQETLEVLKSLK
jgi:glycosyltransferase involved in cell wall biosynthesis